MVDKERIYALKRLALMRILTVQKAAKERDQKSCAAYVLRVPEAFWVIQDTAFQKKVKPFLDKIQKFFESTDKDKAMADLETETLNLIAIFEEEGIK